MKEGESAKEKAPHLEPVLLKMEKKLIFSILGERSEDIIQIGG
jgi:hypothetical protein